MVGGEGRREWWRMEGGCGWLVGGGGGKDLR